ncbi:MAG: 3',5'-cyclic-nucleotide phosphodiesterase [Gammaproteobacteria bacterium]|nr:3',5'-cyclic-nucleotide phosphodiesterase [Gammaproteobacteria bacterium]
MQVRILGCSGGIGAGLKTTSILLDHDLLIDAGTGVGDLSLEELRRLRHVFLTHSHLDHVVGLPLFIDAAFEAYLENPLQVHASQSTIDALRAHLFNDVIWPDFSILPSAADAVMHFEPLAAGDVLDINSRQITAVAVKHAVPTLGYCVEAAGKVLAFSADTTNNQTLWPVLNAYENVDVLVIEVSFPNRQAELAEKSGHYCPRTLAQDLAKLNHNPAIWLTAMKPGEEELIMDEVRVELPDRTVRRLESGLVFYL